MESSQTTGGAGVTGAPAGHPASMLARALRSAGSTVSPHRTLVAIQASANSHHAERFGGCHSAGSRSDFDRLVDAVTAMSARGSPRSLANARRRPASHAQAPESHASARATTWSTSSSEELSVEYPS